MATRDALQVTAAAVQSAAELAQVRWEDVCDFEVLQAAVELGRLRAVVDGALVAIADRLEATGATDAAGWASTKDFLTHVLGGRKGAGASLVRVAKQTAEHADVRAGLQAGEVSFAQASVIGGRIATCPTTRICGRLPRPGCCGWPARSGSTRPTWTAGSPGWLGSSTPTADSSATTGRSPSRSAVPTTPVPVVQQRHPRRRPDPGLRHDRGDRAGQGLPDAARRTRGDRARSVRRRSGDDRHARPARPTGRPRLPGPELPPRRHGPERRRRPDLGRAGGGLPPAAGHRLATARARHRPGSS